MMISRFVVIFYFSICVCTCTWGIHKIKNQGEEGTLFRFPQQEYSYTHVYTYIYIYTYTYIHNTTHIWNSSHFVLWWVITTSLIGLDFYPQNFSTTRPSSAASSKEPHPTKVKSRVPKNSAVTAWRFLFSKRNGKKQHLPDSLYILWCTYIHTLHYITYIQTHIHTYIHTYIHIYIHTYIQTYIHTYILVIYIYVIYIYCLTYCISNNMLVTSNIV